MYGVITMLIDIYHGSNAIIEKPIYGFGKTYNDYGLGFYCTYDLGMAKEWGVGKTQDGYANHYQIEDSNLKVLQLNNKDFTFLHWLAILLNNREFDINSTLAIEAKEYILNNFLLNYEIYDVIIGYRADDSYFSFAQDFLNGAISYRQLCNAMRLGRLGLQYVLKSKKAFEQISFIDYEIAYCQDWYQKKYNRDKVARKLYFDLERNRRQKGDIYILNILDEEMKANDSRLRTAIFR